SCHDEHLDHVYESEMKIERNEKGRLDVRSRVDELEDNKIKRKEAKVKNDVEEVVMNRVGNDYANDKVKTKIVVCMKYEKVESVEAKMVNVVNIDQDEEGKADMSELKVENLPESLDEEENRNDGVQALEYCQKSADEENVSSRRHSDDKEDKIIRDENKALICYQNADITNKDENKILEEDSKRVEGEESFREPKLEDNYRLVFDQEKIIESGNPIFNVTFEIINIGTILKGSNSENAVVGLNEDVGEI
ncbi:6635_t:CDS:2, partial [Racocetra persica]